jgi:hypothetical protein
MPEAKKAVSDLKDEGRETEADDAKERLDVLLAAEAWQLQYIPKARFADLQTSHKTLEGVGFQAPLHNRAVYTKRAALEWQRDQDVTDWLDTVKVGDVAAGEGWKCAKPSFKTLFVEYGQLDDAQKASAFPAGATLPLMWADSVLSDAFLVAMDTLSEELKCKAVVDVVTTYLTWSTQVAKIPPEVEQLATVVEKCMKGFAALFLPKPGAFGSTDEHVGYLRDTLTEGSVLTSDLRTRKALVRKLRRTKTWVALYDLYDSKKGAESEHGPAMLELEKSLNDLCLQASRGQSEEGEGEGDFGEFLGKAKELVRTFSKSIVVWRNSLRPGATDDVDAACTSVIGRIVTHAKAALAAGGSDRTEGLQMLDLVSPVLKLVKNDSGLKLLQEVCDLTTAWRSKDKVASLASALACDMSTDAQVADLSVKLSEASNLELTKEILEAMPPCIVKLAKFAGGRVFLQPSPDVDVYDCIFNALLARAAFCDVSGGKAKLSAAFRHFIAAARSSVALASSVDDLKAKAGNEDAMKLALEKTLVAIEGRPQHDVLKENQIVGPVITAIGDALAAIAEQGDDIVTDNRGMFVECAGKAKELSVLALKAAIAAVEPISKGGVNGQPWHAALRPDSVLATDVPEIFKALDQSILESSLMSAVEAGSPLHLSPHCAYIPRVK